MNRGTCQKGTRLEGVWGPFLKEPGLIKWEGQMNNHVISKTGVRVSKDYRDNVIVDKASPALKKKALLPRETYNRGNVKGLSRLGSENSEDIKSWNLFRALQLKNNMKKYYDMFGVEDNCERVLFWGLDPDTGEFDKNLKSILDKIEPPHLWTIQQTEPDVVIIGNKTLIFNESKLGKPDVNIDAWNRKDNFSDKHELYKNNSEKYFKKKFVDNFSVDAKRFYQLMRNYIVGSNLAERLNKKFYLVALVSKENKAASGLSHREEFELFCSNLKDSTRCHLLTWDQFGY